MDLKWQKLINIFMDSPSGKRLSRNLKEEEEKYLIYPPKEVRFLAFELTPMDQVRVVILGQDPYHQKGQAHGLSFSVPEGIKFPPSLKNIFKELQSDLNVPFPHSGDLTPWAKQGVLLLNTVLTVREGEANSHQNIGWQDFTEHVIRVLNVSQQSIIFVLWGKQARAKKRLIDQQKHVVIEGAHPSPLSSYRGFFGSRPFSQINKHLKEPINWQIN